MRLARLVRHKLLRGSHFIFVVSQLLRPQPTNRMDGHLDDHHGQKPTMVGMCHGKNMSVGHHHHLHLPSSSSSLSIDQALQATTSTSQLSLLLQTFKHHVNHEHTTNPMAKFSHQKSDFGSIWDTNHNHFNMKTNCLKHRDSKCQIYILC